MKIGKNKSTVAAGADLAPVWHATSVILSHTRPPGAACNEQKGKSKSPRSAFLFLLQAGHSSQ